VSRNIFDDLNFKIAEFVRRPENRRLLPGTGSYSALFRGTLFGLETSADVAKGLKTKRVDVLWLGANPCLPRSLKYVLDRRASKGDFPMFQQQSKSGRYASCLWDGPRLTSDWNPLQKPTGNWTVYRDALKRVTGLERIAMANVIPWGSRTTDDFVRKLSAVDKELLARAFRFADKLNVAVISALKPHLVVVPFSLGRNPNVDAVHRFAVAMASAGNLRTHRAATESGWFTFHSGTLTLPDFRTRVLYLRHPASLRLTAQSKRLIRAKLANVIGRSLR
jgi:hypothetical protein